jgi:hypothetical protein
MLRYQHVHPWRIAEQSARRSFSVGETHSLEGWRRSERFSFGTLEQRKH